MLEAFKHEVCEANRRLADENLATLNWGAVSGYDKHTDTVAIMPAGVAHEDVKPQDIVLVDLDGDIIEGRLEPCRDTPTPMSCRSSTAQAGASSNGIVARIFIRFPLLHSRPNRSYTYCVQSKETR